MPAHKKQPGTAVGHAKRAAALVVLPTADEAVPAAPSGLLASSRKRWDAFWRSPVSAAVDRNSDMGRLERWINAVDEFERVSKMFKAGRLVRGSTGQIVLSPLASYLNTLETNIAKTEAEFGMTPYSRLKLGIAVGEAHRSLADLNAELEQGDDDAIDDPRITIVQGTALAE